VKEFERFLEIARALEAEQAEYVIFGGAALNVHGLVRATEDVDVFIRVTAENVERVKRALRRVWDDPCIDDITYEDLSGDYPAVRYGPPDETIYLDILARLGEAYRYEDIEAQTVRVRNTDVRVATPRMLYVMKRDTVRPRDHVDAAALKSRFHIEE
jgi:hypothetical protein